MAVEMVAVRGRVAVTRHPGLVPAGRVARQIVRGALIWGATFGLITLMEVTQFAKEYPTAADRARLVRTMGSDVGLKATFGPSPRIDTVAGYAATHLLGVLSIIGAIWGLLAATRLLRGEEEAGRWELLLSGQTTRRRAAAAAVAGLGVGVLALWAVTAASYVAIGQSPDARFSIGAALFAAVATVAAAAMFLAVGALCSQLAATRRQAAGLAAAVFGIAYLIRVVAYSSSSFQWLRWASPLVWVDELRPLTGSRPLPLLPIIGSIGILVTLTILLAGRRDLGTSILSSHDTAAARTRSLSGPLGLAGRLDRGALLSWGGGLAAGGLIVGLITKGTERVLGNASGGAFVRLSGGATGGAVFLGVVFLMLAALVGIAAAGQVAATREEEAEGYLDHLLARPVARLSWLAGRFGISAVLLAVVGVIVGVFTWLGAALVGAGMSFPDLLAAGVNLVPVGIVVLGFGTLAHGLAPRFAPAIAYGLVAWSFIVEIVGTSIGAAQWLLHLSVLDHIARAPAAAVNWENVAILVVIGVSAAVLGALAFARRDLQLT